MLYLFMMLLYRCQYGCFSFWHKGQMNVSFFNLTVFVLLSSWNLLLLATPLWCRGDFNHGLFRHRHCSCSSWEESPQNKTQNNKWDIIPIDSSCPKISRKDSIFIWGPPLKFEIVKSNAEKRLFTALPARGQHVLFLRAHRTVTTSSLNS